MASTLHEQRLRCWMLLSHMTSAAALHPRWTRGSATARAATKLRHLQVHATTSPSIAPGHAYQPPADDHLGPAVFIDEPQCTQPLSRAISRTWACTGTKETRPTLIRARHALDRSSTCHVRPALHFSTLTRRWLAPAWLGCRRAAVGAQPFAGGRRRCHPQQSVQAGADWRRSRQSLGPGGELAP